MTAHTATTITTLKANTLHLEIILVDIERSSCCFSIIAAFE
jgi:hypothetical protein